MSQSINTRSVGVESLIVHKCSRGPLLQPTIKTLKPCEKWFAIMISILRTWNNIKTWKRLFNKCWKTQRKKIIIRLWKKEQHIWKNQIELLEMTYYRNKKLREWSKIICVKISDILRTLSRIKHKEIRYMKIRRIFKDKEDIWEETVYVSSRGENTENGEKHYSETQVKKFMELKKQCFFKLRKTITLRQKYKSMRQLAMR